MSTSEDEGLSSPDEQTLLGESASPMLTSGSEYEEVALITSSSDDALEDNIAAVHGPTHTQSSNNDIYDEVQKSCQFNNHSSNGSTVPAGWRKCSDEQGDYYWQVRTGRIQRDCPPETPGEQELASPDDHLRSMESCLISLEDQTKSISLNDDTPPESRDVKPEQALRFRVHSIGWAHVVESDLKDQDTSCRAINRCIIDLTTGRSNEGMGHGAEGKELCMEIDGREMCLVDPVSTTVLSVQPIHTIRVWGVGSQNTCDFAYVARDPSTRLHKCHVFRCDVPAKQIANTLKEICGRLAKERKLKSGSPETEQKQPETPDALNLIQQRSKVLLPSPMDGPSKTKKCHYLGCEAVHKPSGMDVLNAVIEKVDKKTNRCDRMLVNMTVTPAAIRVSDVADPNDVKLDCRLRFLCFFGISIHEVRLMGVIVHTSDDEYMAHVFHCEPSAGSICKILEAACKLRYQKQLDSMPADQNHKEVIGSPTANKSIQETVKNLFSRVWSGKKS